MRAAALVAVVAGLLAGGLDAGAAAPVGSTSPTTPSTSPADSDRIPGPPTPDGAWLARVQLKSSVWSAPSFDAQKLGAVSSETFWGSPAQLLVLNFRYVGTQRWAKVRLPGRPNRHSAWVSDLHLKLVRTVWRIDVSVAQRRLRVFRAGKLVRLVPIVVGAPGTPTPRGTFAIADRLRQPDDDHFVGSWVLPLTAHSNTLREFDGGDGQVALHGRGGASLLDPVGTARSHGCMRLSNASIAWIADRVPTGTPVTVR